MFGSTQPQSHSQDNEWREQLADFAQANQQELAALAWGLWKEWGESDDTLGIDLEPTPHFVSCPQEAIATLNQNVHNKLKEVLGIVDNHNPETEVLLICLAKGQIKLIQYKVEPPPPVCFEQAGVDVETLLSRLEERLCQQMKT
jgi:hypothetical protein